MGDIRRHLAHSEPHMDGTVTYSMAKYYDRPGSVGVTLPPPFLDDLYRLIERDETLADYDGMMRLRELLDNPPHTDPLRRPWNYQGWVVHNATEECGEWIDAVVAAHKAGSE